MTAKLTAKTLTLFRGDRCLFDDLSFALDAGELLVLEGDNGSGKTSLMRAIACLLPLERGEFLWDGKAVNKDLQDFRGVFAWLGHRSGLKADLTPLENLRFETSLRSRNNTELAAVFERLGIERLRSLPVRLLSAGQQRRVALARLLLTDVPLWLVDEPFTNLDRQGRKLVEDLIGDHLERGGLCVMTAHQDVGVRGSVRRLSLS
ncbi:MAG: cytochrome c biogenesis heme-transporting ATPase CcmA [Pseudomonadota bacterium]